jgi:hypothetical protein
MGLFTGTGSSFLIYLCTFPYAAAHNEAQIQTQVQYCNVRDNKSKFCYKFFDMTIFLGNIIKLNEHEEKLQGDLLGGCPELIIISHENENLLIYTSV